MFVASGVSLNELHKKGRKVVRKERKQVLLIAADERVFAIANRCPHEGYPLSEGTLGSDCLLTCNWHNWKFDLRTGEALVGRDPVRAYPVELRGEDIFIDLADPSAEKQRQHALKGLEAAISDNDMARMAREIARLERAGFDAPTALSHAVTARNVRLEDGMTHAHAAAADWLMLAERAASPEQRLTAVLEPVAHLAEDTLGADEFPYPDGKAEWSPQAFVSAVEMEDEAQAIALLRGALSAGLTYVEMRPAFAEAALAHYADFGHCAIYTFKTGQLISRLGDEAAEPLLLALTRMLVRSTREERLPEFRFYAKALAAWDGTSSEAPRTEGFIGSSIDGALKRALASSGRPAREVYDALLGASAWNLLHFDRSFEQATGGAIADNIGWLDFTHALTFSNACRHLCEERPDLWPRTLLQMALFVGRNRKYVSDEQDTARWCVDANPFSTARWRGCTITLFQSRSSPVIA